MMKPGVTASLFDRLLADDDESSTYLPGHVSETAYIASAARDIENLLNSRNAHKNLLPVPSRQEPLKPWRTDAIPERTVVEDMSILKYGVPDFSSLSLVNGKDRDRLIHEVTKAIQTFDRRFSDVEVRLADKTSNASSLHFLIRARLRMADAASPVGFEAWFQSTTLQFSITPETPHRR